MRLERRETELPQSGRKAFALREQRLDVRRVGKRGYRERGRERRHRRGRLACVQVGGDILRRERVSDARPGEPEQLREGPQHDHLVVEERQRRLAAVLEVRLVDDERARGGDRVERPGRVVRATGKRERRHPCQSVT